MLRCVSLVEWYYCTTGNRIQMPPNSLFVFLFFTLSPNKLFHGDALSPNNLKHCFWLFCFQANHIISIVHHPTSKHLSQTSRIRSMYLLKAHHITHMRFFFWLFCFQVNHIISILIIQQANTFTNKKGLPKLTKTDTDLRKVG